MTNRDIDEMTDQQKNIKCAELLGWRKEQDYDGNNIWVNSQNEIETIIIDFTDDISQAKLLTDEFGKAGIDFDISFRPSRDKKWSFAWIDSEGNHDTGDVETEMLARVDAFLRWKGEL